MAYIVYLTSGSHSDYSVESRVLVGEADPTSVLDTLTLQRSEGVWRTWDAVRTDVLLNTKEEYDHIKRLATFVRKGAVDALKRAGFKEMEAKEVWLG